MFAIPLSIDWRKPAALALATLALATALTVVPLPLVGADVASVHAHDKQECFDEAVTTYPSGRNGPPVIVTRPRCVSVDHSHPVRGIIAGVGSAIGCGVLGSALGPGGALAAGAACGGFFGGLLS